MPEQQREGRDPSHEPERPAGPDRPGVLVVDDENLVRITVHLGLERNGFRVWSASSAREALDLYRQFREQIDVVVLDDCLPDLDGPATLGSLRELRSDLRACVMSNRRGNAFVRDWIGCGEAHVVAKPFFLEDLTRALRLAGVPEALPARGGERIRKETLMPAILVVDDDRDTCRNMTDLFSDCGYRVDAVENGPSALARARHQQYDVGLLDLRMPGMDGLTLCRRLLQLCPGMVPLIVTGFPGPNLDDEAREAGAHKVFVKPIDVARLIALVERIAPPGNGTDAGV